MRLGSALLLVSTLALATTASSAHAEPSCRADHEKAQEDRQKGQLLRARDELLRCSAAACPSLVQSDCETWLDAVTKDLPTIVPSARSYDGHELHEVSVSFDDAPLLDALDGRAIPVDPGPHTLRFRTKGERDVEVSIVAKTGAKNEPVAVTFAAPAASTGTRPRTIATWSLVGAGAAGLVLFAGLSIAGEVRYHQLKTTCAPSCSHADVSRVRSEFVAGDVSLAVGSALVGAGLVVYLATSEARAEPPRAGALFVRPEAGGASLGTVFTF